MRSAIDPANLGPAPRRIVANLPYNISTALLVRWLQSADALADMVLMFQKEVVDRLVAVPRTKDYGRLSVLAQHVCEVRRLFDVRALRLRAAAQGHLLRRAPDAAAGRRAPGRPRAARRRSPPQRSASAARCCGVRCPACSPIRSPLLEGLGLSPTARAEELSVADFVRLAGVLTNE